MSDWGNRSFESQRFQRASLLQLMMFILGVYIYSRWNYVLRLETFKSLTFEALFTQGAWARSDAMPQCDTMKEIGLCVHSKDISLCPKAIRRHGAQEKRRKVWMTLLYIKLKIPETLISVPRFCHFEVPPLSLWKVQIKFCLSLHSSKWNLFCRVPHFSACRYSGSANTRTPADSRMEQGAGWSREPNRESSKRNLFSPPGAWAALHQQ